MKIERKILTLYYSQKSNSKNRGHNPPKYSKEEFLEYCLKSEKFQTLYKNWVASGFKKDLAPSIDRLDDYKGYSFKNIQVMTWKENRDKYYSDHINRINSKSCTKVKQICIITNSVLNIFDSLTDAYISTNTPQSNILKCCKNIRLTANGYKWSYV